MSNGGVRVEPKNYKRYERFQDRMTELRSFCLQRVAFMAAQSIRGEVLIGDYVRFSKDSEDFFKFINLDGIEASVREVENDPAYDILGLTGVTIIKLDAAANLIDANFPEHNDYKLVGRLEDGKFVSRSFTSTQTQTLRASYQEIIDTINAN